MSLAIGGSLVLGSLLSGGANVAGGLLGQESFSMGDQILPTASPSLDLALQGANFASLNPVGFGDISTIPGPQQRLVAQIQALPLDEKTKRRGLAALNQIFQGQEPSRGVAPFADAVLRRVGLSEADLPRVMEQEQAFRSQIDELSSLQGLNTGTILERARAADAAAQLLGAGASAATGGPTTALQQQLLDRRTREIDRAQESSLLAALHGGFNPARALGDIAELRADAPLRAIEDSLMFAGAITNGLNAGTAPAQNAAGVSTNANLGALGIAANQSAAANQLQQAANANSVTSLANGVAGGINSLAQPLTTFGTLAALDQYGLGGRAPTQ